jgi:hypothetical protein
MLALAAIMPGTHARAAEAFFLGDSIAADTAETMGLKGAARQSVSLRRNAVAPQFAHIPKGAIAIMSLGLNDASDPVENMRKDIEMVIEGAEKTGEKFVWVGPPCVLKAWDHRAKAMDDYLRARLAKTAIQYVSLRDPQICHAGLRTGDGEHFTDRGYRYIWQKIQRDSSFGAEVEMPARAPFTYAGAAPKVVAAAVPAIVAAKAKTVRVAAVASTKAKPKPKKKRPRRSRNAEDWD